MSRTKRQFSHLAGDDPHAGRDGKWTNVWMGGEYWGRSTYGYTEPCRWSKQMAAQKGRRLAVVQIGEELEMDEQSFWEDLEEMEHFLTHLSPQVPPPPRPL